MVYKNEDAGIPVGCKADFVFADIYGRMLLVIGE